MFALTSMAMADAFISSWNEKYRSNVVRPVTVIREHIDPAWETVVVTPPFPEYTSGHSVVSGAAAAVLEALLGEVSFRDSTHLAVGLDPRPFESLWAAAEEAAVSRLYGGIHYPMAIDHGLSQGRCLGELVLDRYRGEVRTP
jgi:membrane-associated phospholipid phosphatase